MLYQFTYYFDDLPVIKGAMIYASGRAEIEYKISPKDPSVGINNPYVDDIEVDAVTIHSEHVFTPDEYLMPDDPLFSLVEKALLADLALQQACMDDYNS